MLNLRDRKEARSDEPILKENIWFIQIGGFIALLLAFAFVPLAGTSFDFYLVGGVALFLCGRYHLKGWFYTLGLLFLTFAAIHLWGQVDHLWRCGIEASMASSFFLIALGAERQTLSQSFLQSQLSTKETVIHNLEEEMSRKQEEMTKEQIGSFARVEQLDQLLEEAEGERRAIEILNDVLRKNQAASFEISNQLEQELDEKDQFLCETDFLLDKKKREYDQIETLWHEASLQHEQALEQLLTHEEELQKLQGTITQLMKEAERPRGSDTLREAFSAKNRSQLSGPSPEETLREALALKKRKVKGV